LSYNIFTLNFDVNILSELSKISVLYIMADLANNGNSSDDDQIEAPSKLKQDQQPSQQIKGKRNISDARKQQLREQMIALREKKSQQAQEKKQLQDQLQLQMEEEAKQKAQQKLQKMEKKVERKVQNNAIKEKVKPVVKSGPAAKYLEPEPKKKKPKKTTIVYESSSEEEEIESESEEEVIVLKKKSKKIPDVKSIKQKPQQRPSSAPTPKPIKSEPLEPQQQPMFQFQFH
jgi:hypothetical protein